MLLLTKILVLSRISEIELEKHFSEKNFWSNAKQVMIDLNSNF